MSVDSDASHARPTFLADTPLDPLDRADALRHKALARELAWALRSCPSPFTIGLAGEWGSGKTTVALDALHQLRADENRQYAVIYFDAWKYQQDSLRRQFLLETRRQLQDQGITASLDEEELYKSTTIEYPPQVDWRAHIPWLVKDIKKRPSAWLRLSLLILTLAAIPTSAILAPHGWLAASIIAALFGGSALTTLGTILPRLIVTKTPTETRPPLSSAEEFDSVFRRWLDDKSLKQKRLVITVDNLDRCPGDAMVDLLADIKTFLEPPEGDVVFLLPVDEAALTKALFARYDSIEFAHEFLRKFFNTLFRMPAPLWDETRDFARAKLRDTQLIVVSGADDQESDHIVATIMAAYPNNPRRVIQFLNRLCSHWLQISATADELKRTGIQRLLGPVAKCVALRDLWPDFAALVAKHPYQLQIAEALALDGAPNLRLAGSTTEAAPQDTPHAELLDGLADFLRATRSIVIERPRLLLTAKADIFELDLPDAELLREYLSGAKAEPLGSLLETDPWQHSDVRVRAANLVEHELDDFRQANLYDQMATLIGVTAPALEYFDQPRRHTLARIMTEDSSHAAVHNRLAAAYPDAAVRLALNVAPSDFSLASDNLLKVLTLAPSEARTTLAKAIADHSDTFSPLRPQLLAHAAVAEDSRVLESLMTHQGTPTIFWDNTVATQCCTKTLSQDDPSQLDPVLPSVQALLGVAALGALPVSDLVFDLLEKPNLLHPARAFAWAARSPALSTSGRQGQDVAPMIATAQALTTHPDDPLDHSEFQALLIRLYPHADETGRNDIQSRLESFLASVPNPDIAALGEEWFPDAATVTNQLPSLLLVRLSAEPDANELRERVNALHRQSHNWDAVSTVCVQLLASPPPHLRALALANAVVELEREPPAEFVDPVWPAAVQALSTAPTYPQAAHQLLTLLWHSLSRQNRHQRAAHRKAWRDALVNAMLAGHDQASSDYDAARFTAADTKADISTILDKCRTRTPPFSASSTPALSFALQKSGADLQKKVFEQILILATEDPFWRTGANAILSSPPPRDARLCARVATELAAYARHHRETDPDRARTCFSAAIHIVQDAGVLDSGSRDTLTLSADALRQVGTLSEAEYEQALQRIPPPAVD